MNNRCVVISTNGNDDYLFYIPIVMWAWNRIGWEVMCMMYDSVAKHYEQKKQLVIDSCLNHAGSDNYYLNIPQVKGVREETLTQCSRLYAANFADFSYMIMTSDADMLPLSDYWKPNPILFTSYGRDLSDRHYPICYLAASVKKWQTLMSLSGNFKYDMRHDLELRMDVHSDKFEDYWQVDQNLVTQRLNKTDVARIDRGISPYTGYPIGRVDRSAWLKSLEQPERIDAHLFRQGWSAGNWFPGIIPLIKECFNVTDKEIKWMDEYRKNYISLL